MRITRLQALAGLAAALALGACQPASQETTAAPVTVTESVFGAMPDGHEVKAFTLTNANGVEVKLMEYGAAIVSLKTPDRAGNAGEITAGFDTLEPYLTGQVGYFGAIVGRYGNRIGRGRFSIDGVNYQVDVNDGANSLHGGAQGFDKRVWTGEVIQSESGAPSVRFTYVSPDGEMGYPGELTAHVTYTLGADDRLTIDYEATTTKATPVNLTNHAYFNLSSFQSDILGHELMIPADNITPVGAGLIPTGQLMPVEGTPFDFRTPTAIGARIEAAHPQIALGGGYDHNWVLNTPEGAGDLLLAARLSDPASGRVLEISTSEPGVQFYSGNFLNGTLTSRGATYNRRTALCLETQHFPDSPNHADFPDTILQPGETYSSRTVLAFSTTAAS